MVEGGVFPLFSVTQLIVGSMDITQLSEDIPAGTGSCADEASISKAISCTRMLPLCFYPSDSWVAFLEPCLWYILFSSTRHIMLSEIIRAS